MTIWYSISAEFTLRPDADRHALAAAVADYEEATVPAVTHRRTIRSRSRPKATCVAARLMTCAPAWSG